LIFNSLQYVAFLSLVLIIYWQLRHRHQNILLIIGSYLFYAAWDWRFLGLLVISTVTDYLVGISLMARREPRARKALLGVSLVVNLGILGFFKYYDFFADSAAQLLGQLGLSANPAVLGIILPVGISFYTFQTMSYTIDIYRGNLVATRDPLAFAVYVAYFPQLVAGPIERAKRLLPQIVSQRSWSFRSFQRGLALITVGLFKKVVIADGVAGFVDTIFSDPAGQSSLSLLLGVYAFALQIYGDFSGYTDIARGSSALLGIELMENFRQPYLSRSITEFWRRWHISLSDWLRDYLYIPLGGNRGTRLSTYRNILITMLLGGLWHGASWTFVTWGGLHGLALSIHRLTGRIRKDDTERALAWKDLPAVVFTFHLVGFLWVFFRAESLQSAWEYLSGLFSVRGAGAIDLSALVLVVAFSLIALFIDLAQRRAKDLTLADAGWVPAGLSYGLMMVGIVIFSGGPFVPFIYFQF
jgi:D-alanyl-lipoteichoic acid acyltransferase DltB (MBOAT superfamily)